MINWRVRIRRLQVRQNVFNFVFWGHQQALEDLLSPHYNVTPKFANLCVCVFFFSCFQGPSVRPTVAQQALARDIMISNPITAIRVKTTPM